MIRGRIIRPADRTTEQRKPNPERARVVRRREVEATHVAQQIITRAEQRAREIVDESRGAALRLSAQAERRAHEEQAARLLQLERAGARELAGQVEQLRADVTRLAIAVAQRLLGRQLDLAPDSVTELVAQVLRSVRPTRRVVIRAHPDDVVYLERRLSDLGRAAEADYVSVEADPAIERGGCTVDTPLAHVDGRLHVQLEAIADALEEQLGGPAAGPAEGEQDES